jgi:hypothetical protein
MSPSGTKLAPCDQHTQRGGKHRQYKISRSVTTLQVVQQNKYKNSYNKDHNHTTSTPFNIYIKAKLQRLSLEAQPPNHRGEPRYTYDESKTSFKDEFYTHIYEE